MKRKSINTVMGVPLSTEEAQRYLRQTALPGIGEKGQMRLRSARVLVVGVGGLGCPVSLYLTAAGIGTIGLVDGDSVELHNLQRQILYTTDDVGLDKVDVSASKLAKLNPGVNIERHKERLTAHNARALIKSYDFIVDATDNLTAKFLIADASHAVRKPYSHAGIFEYMGQTITVLPGKTSCYRCIFDAPPPLVDSAPRGPLGVIPAVIGSIQATETVKFFTGTGQLLADNLLVYNALAMTFRKVKTKRNPNCILCGSGTVQPPLQNDKDMLDRKLSELRAIVRTTRGIVIAFSGGVDSTFLAAVAHDILGDRALAVTALSPLYPAHEQVEARKLAGGIGIRHQTVASDELDVPGFAENPPNRCYLCKDELFTVVRKVAAKHGISIIADGTNADDSNDYRPGRKAAAQHGVISPLLDAGLSKAEIRELSKRMKLPTAGKAAFACLASRFPYGTRITKDKLAAVGAVEDRLREMGFRQFRVRHHGDIARIEVGKEEIKRFLEMDLEEQIVKLAKKAGFSYVALDIEGYRTGSLNTDTGLNRKPGGGSHPAEASR
ncbi:MAG: ATP-dependent sacrificial sulfur transferase LarE [Kiritimatiellia bacterium]